MRRILALVVSLGLLVGCNPESFLSKDKVTSEAGRVSEAATVKNYARGLEAYALAAQEVLVSEGGAVESFTAGSVDGAQALGGVDNSAMASMYCSGTQTQISWMNNRDANDVFVAKGLGRNAGERILSNVAGLSPNQIGYYDGLQIQMVDGTQIAIPDAADCGSEVVNIPVGAPVVVFAGIMKSAEQVATTQGYEYRNEACQDASEDGTTLYRELVKYSQLADGTISKNVTNTELVSSNCSNADQLVADAALAGNALSNSNIVGAGTFAGGGSASTGALEGALGDQLSSIDCREVEGTQAVDLNGDGTIDEDEQAAASNFDTCGEGQVLAANDNALDESLQDETEWKILTTECGGAGDSNVSDTISTSSGNKAGLKSYPAYSGVVTYRQKKYISQPQDGTGDTYIRYGAPEAYAINCNRVQTAIVACSQITPSGYNASTWSNTGGQYNYSRNEAVSSFADASTTPPTPSNPVYSNWSFTNTNCQWREVSAVTSCPSGQALLSPGERTTIYQSSNDTGGKTTVSSSITSAPSCAPIVAGGCGSANGTTRSSAPSGGSLCSAGTASAVSGSGPWSWTCTGEHGGGNSSCSASASSNGSCGSANGATLASAPSGGSLCSSGTASAVSGSGPWSWSCNSTDGGGNASCSASKAATAVNGACGAANNACTAGTLVDLTDTSTDYKWRCDGQNGGSNSPTCSKPKPIAGACGAANNACTSGTLSDVADTSTEYKWNCNGQYGGGNASCSLPKAPPPGSCNYSGNIYADGATIAGSFVTTFCSNHEATQKYRKCCSGSVKWIFIEECGAATTSPSCANPHGI
ncbi:MAG: hypothetical protein CMH30_04820 [Micavibrio sp.]|nr:hypothetical protein [Micavibrio sp.]